MTDTRDEVERLTHRIEATARPDWSQRLQVGSMLRAQADTIEALRQRAEAAEALAANYQAMYEHNLTVMADASAALQARLDAEWNAAIEAAADAVGRLQRQDVTDSEGFVPPDRFDEGTDAAYERIRALRRSGKGE